MNNFREVKDDILKEWLDFRDQEVFCELTKQDKEYSINFDEITTNILNNIPKQNQKYVQDQLDQLYDNILNHVSYWTEKYYRHGFCDGVELIGGCIE